MYGTKFLDRQAFTKEQSEKIQVLRGLAIIAVVFIHSTPNGLTQVWGRPFMNFSVGLFLFLSGLLSCAEHWNPVKRIIKVAIPYLIWTLIYVIFANINSPAHIPAAYIKSLFFANSAAVMYYVFVYCQFTLLIPLIDKLAHSKVFYLGFIIAPIEIIIVRYIPLYMGFTLSKYILYMKRVSCLGWFTYFYIGYLIGNKRLRIKNSTVELVLIWMFSILLQIGEGYLQFSFGELNCGTQLKLTSILSGTLFALLAYKYIISDIFPDRVRFLRVLGDNSFGIYFSHLAVMTVFVHIPYYSQYVVFPFNAIVTIVITLLCVKIGKKILGKYAKYLAL